MVYFLVSFQCSAQRFGGVQVSLMLMHALLQFVPYVMHLVMQLGVYP